jgi:hypothetical protein
MAAGHDGELHEPSTSNSTRCWLAQCGTVDPGGYHKLSPYINVRMSGGICPIRSFGLHRIAFRDWAPWE